MTGVEVFEKGFEKVKVKAKVSRVVVEEVMDCDNCVLRLLPN
jgi:hypothetical protein